MMTEVAIKILSLSDGIVSFIYSPQVKQRFNQVDLVIGCGDLAYYYLEYVLDALDRPCFFVRGNHDKIVEYNLEGQRTRPAGAIDLHRKAINCNGVLLGGVEGCQRYRPGPFQYSQREMWLHVFSLVPTMLVNRLRFGRFLDIFVTHAPPAGVHDAPDLPHQGIKAFNWMLAVFRPAFHFHGHIHTYRPDAVVQTQVHDTQVINSFQYQETIVSLPRRALMPTPARRGRNRHA